MKSRKYLQIISVIISVALLISIFGFGNVFATTSQNTIYSNELMVDLDADAEKILSVPVLIKNNTGIAGFELNFAYDANVLTPIEIEQAEGSENVLTDGLINDTISTSNNSFKVIWSGSSNLSTDGTLFYINFSVNSEATGSTTVQVDYNKENTFDENIDEVEFNCQDIVININNSTYDPLPKLTLIASNITAGDSVILNGLISNVGSLTSAKIKIDYDSTTFSCKSIEGDSNISVSNIESESGYIVFNVSDISTSVEGKALFSITFKCSDTADLGLYLFSGSAESVEGASDIFFTDCNIKVLSSATSDSAVIKSDAVVLGKYGKTLSIPIYISNNKGLMGYKLKFEYDTSLLKPIQVVNSNLLSGTLNDNIGVHEEYFNVMWNSVENKTNNGQLFIVEFEVLSNTKTNTEIKVSFSQEDTFNENYEDVTMICDNISVTLNPLLGDVNCDGVVNSADYSLLVSAVSLEAQLTDYQNAIADLNCDKAVDGFDAIKLDLYLNGLITDLDS